MAARTSAAGSDETRARVAALPARAWLTVALVFFVAVFNYLDRTTITTMRGSVVAAIPMTETQFGLLTSAFYWTYGVLSPFAGFLADRFSRKRILVGSLLWWSVITWLTAYTTTFGQLLTTRLLMGASEACAIPAALALIADYHRGPTRSLATGIHMCGIHVGVGLSGIGGWLAEKHGWSYAFRAFGLVGVAYSVLMIFWLRDAPRIEPVPTEIPAPAGRIRLGSALANLLSRGSFLIAIVYWAVLGIIGGSLTGWLPSYLGEHFHLSQGRAGLYATAALQPAALIGLLIGGVWADRWSRTRVRGRILVPVIGLCLAGPAVLLAANTPLLALALTGLILFYFFKAFTDSNMMPILCLVADPRYRATGYGVLNLASCLVIGLTIYIGGALRDAHVEVSRVFDCGAVGLALCAGLLFLVKPATDIER